MSGVRSSEGQKDFLSHSPSPLPRPPSLPPALDQPGRGTVRIGEYEREREMIEETGVPESEAGVAGYHVECMACRDGLITSVLALEEAGGGISEVRALGYVRVKAQVGAGDVVTARGEGLPEAGLEARLCEKRPFRSAESLSVHLVRNSVFDME